jgi:hypothetical protein
MTSRSPRSTWWRDPSLWITAGVAGRHAIGALQLRRTTAFLTRPRRPTGLPGSRAVAPALHVVVPVLWEQAHVGAAMHWFATLLRQLPGSTLTVVSTAREDREREHLIDAVARCPVGQISIRRFPHLTAGEVRDLAGHANAADRSARRAAAAAVLSRRPRTGDVVAGLLQQPEFADLPIRHVHYPGDGRKAAQVNFAVTRLGAADSDYVAVYDVDSRPDLQLIRRTLDTIADTSTFDGEVPPVVQQSARFEVAGSAGQVWQWHVCRGAARLQTLWTLRREIPSFRRYTRAIHRPTGVAVLDAVRRGLAQTVGHGLLIRADVYHRLGGLPEDTMLDDLPFGYRLTAAQIPVQVVPVLSVAPAPERVGDLISTHRRWFRNYLDYPACARAAHHDGLGSAAVHAVALGVAGYRAVTWLLASPATVACAVALLRRTTPLPVRALAATCLWWGCVTPVRMLAAAQPTPTPLAVQARDAAEVFAAYLVNSIGPAAALAQAATDATPATGFALSPKTHRRHDPKEPR